jgi:hypothetical protein
MSIYVADSFTGTTYPLTHGRVCWDAASGTVTASTEASGFDADNAATVRTDSAWRPTTLPATWEVDFGGAQEISYFAIAKHDLGTQNASIRFQYDTGAGYTNVSIGGGSLVSPADDSPILVLSPVRNAIKARIQIQSADSEPTLSVVRFGLADEWPRPFVWTGRPITEGDRTSFENTISLTGNWLGRTVTRDGLQFELTMNNAPESWRRGDFAAFKAYANGSDAAFFIAPRPTADYLSEVAYAWATDVVTAERAMANKLLSTSVTLQCQGLRPNG